MTRSRRNQRRGQAPGWLWLLVGLGLGLVVAGGVYVTGTRDAAGPAATVLAPSAPVERPAAAPETRAAEPAPPRFEFYEVLPQFEVVIPESESPAAAPSPIRAVEEPGSYVLQVGAFTSLADADRRQATLALLGIESSIQEVTIGRDVFHRVRVGPLNDLATLNRVRGQLRDARIESLLMRAPD